MKVRNVRDCVVVIAPAGANTGITVEAGGVADVDSALGKSLLEQPDRWEAVKSPFSKKPSGEKE